MFDGKAFAAEVIDVMKGYVAREIEPLRAENASLVARIAELEARPVAKDGAPGAAGRDGEPGRDGKDVDPEDLAGLVDAAVEKAVGALPRARDGRDGIDGKDGAPGRDGLDVNELFVAEGGNLVAVFSDGRTKDLGQFRGTDGTDGRDGTDGAPGRDGVDGLGFEDMDERFEDDGRTVVRTYRCGEVLKEFRFSVPAVLDRGVYKAGQAYERGDGVTWAGSFWIAQKQTEAKPDGSDGSWRLAVKRGRDGKDGRDGDPGQQGREGPRGRDLTQLGADGGKW